MKSYPKYFCEQTQDVQFKVLKFKTPFHIVLFPTWLITFPLSGYNGNDKEEQGDIDGE